MERNIMCIDLKSFFASCECLERNIDPYKVPLVVANPNQGNGAITLAITPALKAFGVKSRSRLYEIPKHLKYMIVPPKMSLYLRKSKEVVNVFLKYVSEDDLHVYSIDESFLDVTDYLNLYKMTDYELAEEILKTITLDTGLTATCGIGPNLLMAKVALDTDAKKYKNGITKWTNEDIAKKLWTIKPLSKMWGIGSKTEQKLNNMGIYSIYDLAHYNPQKLKDKFGINGIDLWNHANGIDESVIKDFKVIPKEASISHSQVLLRDYNYKEIPLIIEEMVDVLLTRLRKSKKLGCLIGFGIGYSKVIGGGFYHSMKLTSPTDDVEVFKNKCLYIYDSYIKDMPIRKVSISIGRLSNKDSHQLNIFENYEETIKKNKINDVVDSIKDKYGKNSLLKASSLLSESTIRDRNKKIGGHSE